ncbi:MAG TPA: RIP metalloprotease RseP, partial [Thiomicrospira sp.]|nr:RIP metalloprotease RseP [Thiomicrospira sp.]
NRQSVYKRFAVVAAGPLINLIFAWMMFTAIYMIGVSAPKPIFDQPVAGSALERVLPNNKQAWLVQKVDQYNVNSWLTVREQLLMALVNDQESVSLTLEDTQTGQIKTIDAVSLAELNLDDKKQNWVRVIGFQPSIIPVPAIIGDVKANGPADLAGIQTGDLIVNIDGHEIRTWQDLVLTVKPLPNRTVSVTVSRDGVYFEHQVALTANPSTVDELTGYMGVGVDVDPKSLAPYMSTAQYGLIDSIRLGWNKNIDFIDMSLVMMKKMLFGEVGLDNLSGPVSIAQFSGQAIQTGLVSFLMLLGLLSLSLGVLNLLPIPVLDGGHLVYYIIEMIKGSPVSEGVMVFGQKIGILLILSLTILALTNDLIRITNG